MMPNQPLDPHQRVPFNVVVAAADMRKVRLPHTRCLWADAVDAVCGVAASQPMATEQKAARVSKPQRAQVPLDWLRSAYAHARTSAPALRQVAVQAGVVWLGTRLGFIVLTYFTIVFSSQYRTVGTRRFWLDGGGVRYVTDFVKAWLQWDAGWYADIARQGYNPLSVAFFPLFPMLVRGVRVVIGPVFHGEHTVWAVSGLIVSNLSTLVAFVAVAILAASETGRPRTGRMALAVLAAYPFAFFLTAPYSEATFLATAALALLCARRGLWWPAVAAAYLAGLTRSAAVVLVLPLAWEYARQHGWLTFQAWRRASWRSGGRWSELGLGLAVIAAVPGALLTYMVFLWYKFGNLLAFVAAVRTPEWGRQTLMPWQTAQLYAERLAVQPPWGFWQLLLLVEGAIVVLFAVVTVAVARRLPFSFTLYMLGLILLIASTPTTIYQDVTMSVGRYMVMAVPVFIALGSILEERPSIAFSLLFICLVLQGGFVSFWLTGAWLA